MLAGFFHPPALRDDARDIVLLVFWLVIAALPPPAPRDDAGDERFGQVLPPAALPPTPRPAGSR